jgi:hypothetical protein
LWHAVLMLCRAVLLLRCDVLLLLLLLLLLLAG